MTDKHWAVFALRDIQNAIDDNRYEIASCHINDAIAAILARDEQDVDVKDSCHSDEEDRLQQRL